MTSLQASMYSLIIHNLVNYLTFNQEKNRAQANFP